MIVVILPDFAERYLSTSLFDGLSRETDAYLGRVPSRPPCRNGRQTVCQRASRGFLARRRLALRFNRLGAAAIEIVQHSHDG
jgi:hypothetical protein